MASIDNIEYAGLTDVGVRRSHNQDAFALLPAPDLEQWHSRGHIFVVADGMGAHAVGELASKMAADAIPHIYSKHAKEGPPAALRRSFIEANSTIHTRGQQNREFEGMGTTSTALVIRPEGAWVGHVGDSRVYRIRGDRVEQISFDHSLVWEMARRQKCDPSELEGIPSNVIVRSLGPEGLVQVDVEGPHPLEDGDIFVICSDGLSGPVSDEEMAAVVTTLPPEEACRLLIDIANLHGGPDNITAVVVKIKMPDEDGDSSSGLWSSSAGTKKKSSNAAIHWPIWSMAAGILLAISAIILTMIQLSMVAYVAFLLAALSLVGGLAGVFFQYKQDTQPPEPVTQASPPKIHRMVKFAHSKEMVDKLSKAFAPLEERLREHGWEADWDNLRSLQGKMEEYVGKEQYRNAFREACRALRLLTEAIRKKSNKEERFRPVWETRSPRHV